MHVIVKSVTSEYLVMYGIVEVADHIPASGYLIISSMRMTIKVRTTNDSA